MNMTTFRSRYDAWLLDVKPLLLEANRKAAGKTYPFIVNEDAPWTLWTGCIQRGNPIATGNWPIAGTRMRPITR